MSFCRRFWLFAILAILFTTNASAQQNATGLAEKARRMDILVLNLEEIRRLSKAVKGIREQISSFRNAFQSDIEKEEKALRVANQELAKKRTILSLEAFAKERRQFEQRVLAVQKLVQKRKRQLDKSRVRAMHAVEKHMNRIVSDIATKRQALLVLRRTDTVLVARDLDITAVVLKRLNKELVEVSVEKPSD